MLRYLANLLRRPTKRVVEINGKFYPQIRKYKEWYWVAPNGHAWAIDEYGLQHASADTLDEARTRITLKVVWTN